MRQTFMSFLTADRGICRNIQNVLRNEKGQTLIEHGLILGVISSVGGVMQNHLTIAIIIIAVALIILLFFKPRILVTVVIIALVLAILLFIYRWVNYGHF